MSLEYEKSVAAIILNDSQMKSSALQMTNNYFERFFQNRDPNSSLSICFDGTSPSESSIGNFNESSLAAFLDTISFTDKSGRENEDAKAFYEKLGRLDRTQLTEEQVKNLNMLFIKYSEELSRNSSFSNMSGEIFGNLATLFVPAQANRIMNYFRDLNAVAAEGKLLVALEKLSGVLNKPFLAGGETGSISVSIGKIEKARPWDLIPTHRIKTNKTEYRLLFNEIENNGGFQETIKYVNYNNEKYVVDGHHRAHISRILRLNEVPIEEVFLPYGNYRTVADLFYK